MRYCFDFGLPQSEGAEAVASGGLELSDSFHRDLLVFDVLLFVEGQAFGAERQGALF